MTAAVASAVPDAAAGPELPATLARCLVDFEAQVHSRMEKAIQEEVRALHVAMRAALSNSSRPPSGGSEGRRASAQAAKGLSGQKRGSVSKNDDAGQKKPPNVSTDFKREATVVFKKKQQQQGGADAAGEDAGAELALTRQSIRNDNDVKDALKRLSEGKAKPVDLDALGPNPVPGFFKDLQKKPAIDMKKFKAALNAGEIPVPFLDVPVSEDVPSPVFFAVGTKNEKLVSLLIEARADARLRFQGDKMWNGVKKGMTALEAASNMKGRFIGTILETKFEAIEEVLRSEEDRLRGWKHGVMVTHKGGADNKDGQSLAFCKTQTGKKAGEGSQSTNHVQIGAAEVTEVEESDDDDLELSEEEEAKLEAESRAFQARMGPDTGRNGKRKSLSLYSSKAALVCEHVCGDPSDIFELGDKLGEGTYGYVRKAIHKMTRVPRAIKTVPKVLLEDSGLWQEIEIMRELDHPHIMKLFATFEDHENLYIISELCSGGDLIDALSGVGSFSEQVAGQLFKQMTCAVSYLHNQGICHRDLKPENFLLSMPEDLRKVHVKLIDFGAARHFGLDQPMTTKICALHYVAPELVSKKEVQYSEKCDVWSLGVVLYLMLCGAPPFWGDDDMAVLKDIRKGRYVYEPAELWGKITDEAKGLINQMLVVDPEKRLAAVQVVKSEWFKKIGAHTNAEMTAEIVYNLRTFHQQTAMKKIALQVIAQQLSDEVIAERRIVFDNLDEDAKGNLEVPVVKKAISSMKIPDMDDDEIDSILKDVSFDDDKKIITYTQFLAATIDRHQYLRTEETVRAAFQTFDLESRGSFSAVELGYLFGNNEALAAALEKGSLDLEDLIKEADLNEDDKIDFDEFFEMMRA